MRPTIQFLDKPLIEKIIAEARQILFEIGVAIHNPEICSLLADHGAAVTDKVRFTSDLIDRALKSAPHEFRLFDVHGGETHHFAGDCVHFTPGSAALYLLDYHSKEMRRPNTTDYIKYAKIVQQLPHIASQSTAIIPADVPAKISDSYRLFLSLLHGEKPVVTGAFTIEGFEIMKNLQLAVRGDEKTLSEKPLTIFSCCPTSPLKWSDVTSQNVLDCARYSIPVEFIAMPLAGFMAPVTLVGTLIQHTAETLSGVVISQTARPGTPVLWGGSPAIFDMRHSTTPMGAIETMMIDCAYAEIGKHIGLPTQAYISLSDAKLLDAQAGLESGMGATLAALAGINSISGPGMIDFESCLSLEKLVLDNEICGMALRLVQGIEPKEDFPSLGHFQEMLAEGHMLTSDHTLKHLRQEHFFPGPVIDRLNRAQWLERGATTLTERAHAEVEKHLKNYTPSTLSSENKNDLISLMQGEAKKYGMGQLPHRDE